MADATFDPDLIELQRAANGAWAAVEAHRRGVDGQRRADPRVVVIEGQEPMLRPWTPAEDAEHERLMAAARTAQEAVRAGLIAGPGLAYEAVQGLKNAARE